MLDEQSNQKEKKMLSRAAKPAGQQRACVALPFGKYAADSEENVNHTNHWVSKRTSFEKPCFGRKLNFPFHNKTLQRKMLNCKKY